MVLGGGMALTEAARSCVMDLFLHQLFDPEM